MKSISVVGALVGLLMLLASLNSAGSPEAIEAPKLESEGPVEQLIELPDAEFSLVQRQRQGPDPASRDYVTVTESIAGRDVLFNTESKDTYDVAISGNVVVIDQQSNKNDFWSRFDSSTRRDIHSITIRASHVIIASYWHLPQSEVTIQAQRVSLVRDGVLDTTPISFERRAEGAVRDGSGQERLVTPAGDGLKGHNGGDIYLVTDILDLEGSEASAERLRIVANGGNGQQGGTGLNGADGQSVRAVGAFGGYAVPMEIARYATSGSDWFRKCGGDPGKWTVTYIKSQIDRSEYGTPNPPTSGGDAIPGGIPGEGGAGGRIYWTGSGESLEGHYETKGGLPGESTPGYTGGEAGNPTTSVQLVGPDSCAFRNTRTTRGADAEPLASRPGSHGLVIDASGLEALAATAYISHESLSAARRYAIDYYASGNLVDAYLRLGSIQRQLNGVKAAEIPSEPEMAHAIGEFFGWPKDEPLIAVKPTHPRVAQVNNIDGEVTLEFTLSTDGRVGDVRVVSASPRRVFERQAVRAILRFRYAPADSERTMQHTFQFPPSDNSESINRQAEYEYQQALFELKKEFGRSLILMHASYEAESQLSSLEVSVAAYLQRIYGGFDHYGNPAGWYPGLSLEIIDVALNAEIESAFQTLWLSELINRKADNRQSALNEMQRVQQNAIENLHSMNYEFNMVQQRLRELQQQVSDAQNQLVLRESELALVRQRIEREWQARKAREARRARRSRLVSSATQMMSLSPIGQPAMAGLGQVISMTQNPDEFVEMQVQAENAAFESALRSAGASVGAARRAEWSPTSDQEEGGVATLIGEASQDFSYRPFHGTLASLQALGQNFDQESGGQAVADMRRRLHWREEQTANDWLKNVSGVASQFAPMVSALQNIRQRPRISSRQKRAELARLQASDAEYQEILAGLNAVEQKREHYERSVQDHLSRSGALISDIAETADGIDHLGTAISQGLGKQDHAAMIFINDMAARAEKRLEKYHYWFSKAFEYRFLEPYPGEFRISRMRERLGAILEEKIEREENGLNVRAVDIAQEDFNSLKAIYTEQLQEVSESILTRLSLSSFSEERIQFELSPNQLEQLNGENFVEIDLWREGVLPNNRTNMRIKELGIDLTALWQGSAQNASVEVRATHSGTGILRGSSDIYMFGHQDANMNRTTFWSSTFWARDKSLRKSSPSNANFEVLRSMYRRLHLGTINTENMRLMSLPPAMATIVLRKFDRPIQNVSELDSVVLDVTLDYENAHNAVSMLHVRPRASVESGFPERDLYPLISVSSADIPGRRDGEGEFMRLYNRGERVQLVAEESFGRLQFLKWSEPLPADASVNGRSLEVEVGETDIVLRPVYR